LVPKQNQPVLTFFDIVRDDKHKFSVFLAKKGGFHLVKLEFWLKIEEFKTSLDRTESANAIFDQFFRNQQFIENSKFPKNSKKEIEKKLLDKNTTLAANFFS